MDESTPIGLLVASLLAVLAISVGVGMVNDFTQQTSKQSDTEAINAFAQDIEAYCGLLEDNEGGASESSYITGSEASLEIRDNPVKIRKDENLIVYQGENDYTREVDCGMELEWDLPAEQGDDTVPIGDYTADLKVLGENQKKVRADFNVPE